MVLQGFSRLDHFQSIADCQSQGLVHIADEGYRPCSHAVTDIHQGLRQLGGFFKVLHESAFAHLDIQHQSVNAFCQFLAHDAGANERNALHRGRHIPQSIKPAIRRSDFLGLADQSTATALQNRFESRKAKPNIETGDGLQLIERAAGETQAAARNHRHIGTGCSDQGGHDEGGLVTNPSGAMLVHFQAGQIAKIHHFS